LSAIRRTIAVGIRSALGIAAIHPERIVMASIAHPRRTVSCSGE
jgi:hypothetical protein